MKRSLVWLLAAGALAGCRYDAPPEISRVEPPGGVYRTGDPIELLFSEPIDEATLVLRVWPGPRDAEGAIPGGITPLLEECRPAAACGTSSLELDGERATLLLAADDIDGGGPLILEVVRGLTDAGGSATGIPTLLDVQILGPDDASDAPVDFADGTWIFVAALEHPVPLVFTLINDIATLDDGSMVLVAAEGDEIEGASKNTTDPSELTVDDTEWGFTLHLTGTVSASSGQRLFATDPFDLDVTVGPFALDLKGVAMTATLTGDHAMEGTFAWETLALTAGGDTTDYEPGSTTFVGAWVPADSTPAGAPRLCGDLCGIATFQCDPPAAFPPAAFCEESP